MAGEFLGRMYLGMAAAGKLPMGSWAIPGPEKNPDSRLMEAYSAGFPEGSPGASMGQSWYGMHFMDAYRWALSTLRPIIERQALADAQAMLHRQAEDLEKLKQACAQTAPHLTAAARKAVEIVDKEKPEAGLEPVVGETGTQFIRRVMRAMLGNALLVDRDPTLLHLFTHPDGVELIHAYARGPTEGSYSAGRAIETAQTATIEFGDSLSGPHIWRFPPLLVSALTSLNLVDVPGLPQYVAALGAELSKTWWDKALDVAGNALFVLDLVGGPAGESVRQILNVVLAGAQWVSQYLRASEQDIAASATDFAEADKRFGKHLSVGDQVFSLITTVGFAVAPFVKGIRKKRVAGEIPEHPPDLGQPPPLDPRAAKEVAELKAAAKLKRPAVKAQTPAKRPAAPAASAADRGTAPAASAADRGIRAPGPPSPREQRLLPAGRKAGSIESDMDHIEKGKTVYEVKKMSINPDTQAEVRMGEALDQNGYRVRFNEDTGGPDLLVDGKTADVKNLSSTLDKNISNTIQRAGKEQKAEIALIDGTNVGLTSEQAIAGLKILETIRMGRHWGPSASIKQVIFLLGNGQMQFHHLE